MPKIIKLSELLPEDIVVELAEGQQYTLPGDPPLELILKIAELFERSENMGDADETEIGLEVLRELDYEMLSLLRMRNPDLERSPFGVLGVQHVVSLLLQAYNFMPVADEGDEGEDPPQASQSRRSNGSQSSSKSSASRRTTGGGATAKG